jgi:hypothetical protein
MRVGGALGHVFFISVLFQFFLFLRFFGKTPNGWLHAGLWKLFTLPGTGSREQRTNKIGLVVQTKGNSWSDGGANSCVLLFVFVFFFFLSGTTVN